MRMPMTFSGPSARAARVATTAESTPPETPTTAFVEAAARELVLEERDQPASRRARGRSSSDGGAPRERIAAVDHRRGARGVVVSGPDPARRSSRLRASVFGLRASRRPATARSSSLQLRQHRPHVREQRRIGARLRDVVEIDARGQQRLLERRRVARGCRRAGRPRANRPGTCARPRCRRARRASRTRRALRRCRGSAGPTAPRWRAPSRRRCVRTRRARAMPTRRRSHVRRRAPRSVP